MKNNFIIRCFIVIVSISILELNFCSNLVLASQKLNIQDQSQEVFKKNFRLTTKINQIVFKEKKPRFENLPLRPLSLAIDPLVIEGKTPQIDETIVLMPINGVPLSLETDPAVIEEKIPQIDETIVLMPINGVPLSLETDPAVIEEKIPQIDETIVLMPINGVPLSLETDPAVIEEKIPQIDETIVLMPINGVPLSLETDPVEIEEKAPQIDETIVLMPISGVPLSLDLDPLEIEEQIPNIDLEIIKLTSVNESNHPTPQSPVVSEPIKNGDNLAPFVPIVTRPSLTVESASEAILKNYNVEMVLSVLRPVYSAMSLRVANFLKGMTSPIGIASGDVDIEKGGWFEIFKTDTSQKASNNLLGFKTKQQGFSLGCDAELSDSLILGVSYTRSNSNTMFTGDLKDEQSTTMHLASIYSEYEIFQKLFLNTYLIYGKTKINHRIGSTIVNSFGTTNGNIYSAKGLVSYVWNFKELALTGMVGAMYEGFKIDKFVEKSNNLTLSIPQRTGKEINANIGFNIKKIIPIHSSHLVPEIHFNIEKKITSSHNQVLVNVNGVLVEPYLNKIEETSLPLYNVGGNLTILRQNIVEFGAGYDFFFKQSFSSHAVYINLLFRF
jgi:outer membrane autotransporter protein